MCLRSIATKFSGRRVRAVMTRHPAGKRARWHGDAGLAPVEAACAGDSRRGSHTLT